MRSYYGISYFLPAFKTQGAALAAALIILPILFFFSVLSGLLIFSVLTGAILIFLAQFLFFSCLFFSQKYRSSAVISRFYFGGLAKWLFLILGFYLAFKFGLIFWGLAIGLGLMLFIFFAVLLIQNSLSSRQKARSFDQ